MNLSDTTKIVETALYSIIQSGTSLLFTWKQAEYFSVDAMARGISEFANHCKDIRPKNAVIDARLVDPQSPALGWVSGQQKVDGQEDYNTWWMREIVPLYHDAKIESLGVATGNPQAPGELMETLEGVNFKIGYFDGLDDASNWPAG